MKPVSANGVKGHILDCFSGEYVFRVYNQDHTFTDYDLRHCDLSVTITDEDAFFYTDGLVQTLDHSPETLGVKE